MPSIAHSQAMPPTGSGRSWHPRPRLLRIGPRRRRSFRDVFLSENLRITCAVFTGAITYWVLVLAIPSLNYVLGDSLEEVAAGVGVLLVMVIGVAALVDTMLAVLALHDQPRSRVIAACRLRRARTTPRKRLFTLSTGKTVTHVTQLMLLAGISIMMVALRPENAPLAVLLVIATGSMVCMWISSVVSFTLEYGAADSHGEGFAFPDCPPEQRCFSEYLYASAIVQTSAGTADVVPRTRHTRNLVRNQAILAHLTSTILIAVGVSVLITALS